MAITPLPTPPSRAQSQATFSTNADAFLAALPGFATEANALAADIGDAESVAVAAAATATTKAGEASGSADAAAASAVTATTKAGEAAGSASTASSAALQVDKRYLGSKAIAPTLDNQGEALQQGAVYYNTSTGKVMTWTGSSWTEGISALTGVTSVNGQDGAVTGVVDLASEQTLTNKTIADPVLTLGGSEGTAGQVPLSQGDGLPPVWAAIPGSAIDYQEFTTSGTWTKPENASLVYVEAVGGGGGGGNHTSDTSGGGGCGGEHVAILLLASSLGATESVTVGAGGDGGADGSTIQGNAGGDSAFGSVVTAYGGNGGSINGYAAFNRRSVATMGSDTTYKFLPPQTYGVGATSESVSPTTIHGGGGGGGAAGTTAATGGTSIFGGNGGDAVLTADTKGGNGVFPGGGGGGSISDGGGGDGADGVVRVWCW
jgi:hypothetical protein